MKIIFNADDFGLTKGVNLGILESFISGVVRSTTLMANQPAFDHAVALAKDNKDLGIGVHLVLSAGKPIASGLKTLVDSTGNFYKVSDAFAKAKDGSFDLDEIEKEYTAQIEKVINAGIQPTHLDGHHHTHAIPHVYEVTARMAKKYNIPVRVYKKSDAGEVVKSVDEFYDDFYSENVSLEFLTNHIKERLQFGLQTIEYMTHTAYVDGALLACTSYALQRVKELDIMCDPSLKQFLDENNIELINYKAV